MLVSSTGTVITRTLVIASLACSIVQGHIQKFSKRESPGAFGSTEPEDKDWCPDLYGKDGPVVENIEQRTTGDCWLLAGMGAIAHSSPDSIRSILSDNKCSKTGDEAIIPVHLFNKDFKQVTYDIKLEKNTIAGMADGIKVADTPANSDLYGASDRVYKDLAYAWPAVIEAAVMKLAADDPDLQGSIVGSYSAKSFEILLGKRIKCAPIDKAAVTMLKQVNAYPMVIDTNSNAKEGWLSDHVYSVISADGKTARFRNPWSYDCPKGSTDQNEGSFTVSVSDDAAIDKLRDNVNNGQICYFEELLLGKSS